MRINLAMDDRTSALDFRLNSPIKYNGLNERKQQLTAGDISVRKPLVTTPLRICNNAR